MIRIENKFVRWCLSAVFAVLILFGTYHNIFSLAAFLLFGLLLVFCDRESVLLQIFFVMPMANIFKLSPGTQSFFTILILAYVVINFVLPRKATALVFIFGLYVVITQLIAGDFNLFRTIKLIFNVLFLSSVLNSEVKINHKEVFFSFIIGNIVASFFGMLDSSFFRIVDYVGVKEVGEIRPEEGEEAIIRFAGLYADPNYYAIGIIISMCLLVILYHRSEINLFFAVLCTVPMVYFLIQTYSKSALIMMAVPLLYLMYSFMKKKKYLSLLIIILLSVFVVGLVLSGQIEALQVVMARIEMSDTSSGTDINKLTTGRFNLWITYLNYIINNIRTALFGDGVAAYLINERASHNTYIDILYHLGVVGGGLLLACLSTISDQSRHFNIKRTIMNYSVMICMIIMYFFLGQLFYFDPPFQIFLAFVVLNLPLGDDMKNYAHSKKTDEEKWRYVI